MEEPLLIGSAEAMRLLGLTRLLFYAAIHKHGLPVVQVSRRKFKFSPVALREWAAKQSKPLDAEAN